MEEHEHHSVLIVDDDQEIRRALRFALEDAGYTVAEAAEGASAIAFLAARHEPWVVVLDAIMNGMDGESMLRRIARDPALRERHGFLLMTAQKQRLPASTRDLVRQLAIPMLHKPFDLDDMLAWVDRIARQIAARHDPSQ